MLVKDINAVADADMDMLDARREERVLVTYTCWWYVHLQDVTYSSLRPQA